MYQNIILIIFILVIIGLCIYNLKTSLYSNYATISLLICGIIYKTLLSIFLSYNGSYGIDWDYLIDAFGGMLILCIPLLILIIVKNVFGGGDLKLLASIGIFFGIKMSIIFLIISIPIGFIIGRLSILLFKYGNNDEIPTGIIWSTVSVLSLLFSYILKI